MNSVRRSYYPLQKDISQILEDFLKKPDDSSFVETGNWAPAVDIKEEKDKFLVIADIPGVDKNDIHISLENNLLSIQGERNIVLKEDKEGYTRRERMSGQFYRHFNLPQTADEAQISASYKNGVLEVTIPKKQMAVQKRIEISTEGE